MESLKRSRLVADLDDVGHRSDQLDSDDSGTDDRSSHGSRSDTPTPKSGKKTRGRVKINMEFIDNKLRRYTTFSKRKSGIMKKVSLISLTESTILAVVYQQTSTWVPVSNLVQAYECAGTGTLSNGKMGAKCTSVSLNMGRIFVPELKNK